MQGQPIVRNIQKARLFALRGNYDKPQSCSTTPRAAGMAAEISKADGTPPRPLAHTQYRGILGNSALYAGLQVCSLVTG